MSTTDPCPENIHRAQLKALMAMVDDLCNTNCRICGRELTTTSELLDDTCTRCFQKARYGRVLTAAEMTEAAR